MPLSADWPSKRQTTVATSSCEAEYIAESEATKETVWLRRLLSNFTGYTRPEAVTIFGDNQGALALAKNPIHHQRVKHVDIRYNFVREKVEGLVRLEYLNTRLNLLADGLTKPLPKTELDSIQ